MNHILILSILLGLFIVLIVVVLYMTRKKSVPQAGLMESYDEGTSPVMLQTFSEETHKQRPGLYVDLKAKVDTLSKYYPFVWLPPPSHSGVNQVGYSPDAWYNLNNAYGTAEEQKQCVQTLRNHGIHPIADCVLNHRNGEDSYTLFHDRNGNIQNAKEFIAGGDPDPDGNKAWKNFESCRLIYNNQIDTFKAYCTTHSSEECCRSVTNPDVPWNYPNCLPPKLCGNPYLYFNRLAHENVTVQNAIVDYLNFLKEVGYDSWRWDFVKGFSAYFVHLYDQRTNPVLSVGEFWDDNPQLTLDWASEANAKVFDFPLKNTLAHAVWTQDYSQLIVNGHPPGVMGLAPTRAVTFIENHDTAPFGDKRFPPSREVLGYVYILTHPGMPCVFAPHDTSINAEYNAHYLDGVIHPLIDLRYSMGIRDDLNTIKIDQARPGLYAAYIDGSKGTIAMKLGSAEWFPNGEGWTRHICGDQDGVGYCVYFKPHP